MDEIDGVILVAAGACALGILIYTTVLAGRLTAAHQDLARAHASLVSAVEGVRGELREGRAVATKPPAPRPEYEASRIPAERWYSGLQRVTGPLKEAGLVDEDALNEARAILAVRGGHLCDHLLALGVVTDEQLRGALKSQRQEAEAAS
jgi:hypothetical protein